MMLADLESIQKRLEKNNKKNIDEDQLKILEIALDCINNDKNISILNSQFDTKRLNQSGLLSVKPKIFVCNVCLLYTSPSPRDRTRSRMPSSA